MEIEDRRVPLSEIGRTVGPAPVTRFVGNVRRNGVVIPILLREVVSGGGTLGYRIVDGNRRVAAARKVGLDAIPARVLIGVSVDEAARLVFMANNFRSANDLTEFLAIMHLEGSGVSRQRIATAAGVTIKSLGLRDRWSKLDRRIYAAFVEGRIAPSVVNKIARMGQPDQRYFGALMEREGRILTADVQDYLRQSGAALPAQHDNDRGVASLEDDDETGTLTSPNLQQREERPLQRMADAVAPAEPSVFRRNNVASLPFDRDVVSDTATTVSTPVSAGGEPPATIVTTGPIPSASRPSTGADTWQRPVTEGLSPHVQQAIEGAARLGYKGGYLLPDLMNAFAAAYQQVAFIENVSGESTRG